VLEIFLDLSAQTRGAGQKAIEHPAIAGAEGDFDARSDKLGYRS
jgi:hypothetical protein